MTSASNPGRYCQGDQSSADQHRGRGPGGEFLAKPCPGDCAGHGGEAGENDQQGRNDLQRPCRREPAKAAEGGASLDRPVPGRILRMGLDEHRRTDEVGQSRIEGRQRPHRRGHCAAHMGGVVRIDHALAVPEQSLLLSDGASLLGLGRQTGRVRGDRSAGEEQDREREPEQAPLAPHQAELRRGYGERLGQLRYPDSGHRNVGNSGGRAVEACGSRPSSDDNPSLEGWERLKPRPPQGRPTDTWTRA